MLAYVRGRVALSKKRKCSFDLNSVLNSLLCTFTHAKNVPVEFWRRYETNLIREVIFAGACEVFYENVLIGQEEIVHRLRIRIAEPRVKNFPYNEAFVISECPFSQAAFDCTGSVAYRWRFFYFYFKIRPRQVRVFKLISSASD